MSTSKKVSVITVNYNSANNLLRMVTSLSVIRSIVDEIIVIDNNSDKKDKNILKSIDSIKVLQNPINMGFAAAVNQGMKISKNECVLLLNPDCELLNNSPIKTFQKINQNKNIGAIGGKIYTKNLTKRQFTATRTPTFLTALFEFTNLKKIFPNNRFSRKFWVESGNDFKTPRLVHSLCGAFMFIRKINNIRFNEKYFLYFEDLDFGKITLMNKLETWFDPESSILHIGGGSNNSIYNTVLPYWYNSRKIYFNNYLRKYERILIFSLYSLEESLLKLYHLIKRKPHE